MSPYSNRHEFLGTVTAINPSEHRLPDVYDKFGVTQLAQLLPTSRQRPTPSQEEEIKRKKPSRPPALFGVAENLLMARVLFVGKYYFQVGLGDTGDILCEVMRRTGWFDYKQASLENVEETQKAAKVRTRLSRVHELKVDTLSFWLQFDYTQGSDVELYTRIEDECLEAFKEKRHRMDSIDDSLDQKSVYMTDPNNPDQDTKPRIKPKGGRKTTTIEEVARRFSGESVIPTAPTHLDPIDPAVGGPQTDVIPLSRTDTQLAVLHDPTSDRKDVDKRLRFAKCEETMVKHWITQGGIEGARNSVILAYKNLPRPAMGESDAYQRVRKVYQKMRQELANPALDLNPDRDYHYDPLNPELRARGPIPQADINEFTTRMQQRKKELQLVQDRQHSMNQHHHHQHHHHHLTNALEQIGSADQVDADMDEVTATATAAMAAAAAAAAAAAEEAARQEAAAISSANASSSHVPQQHIVDEHISVPQQHIVEEHIPDHPQHHLTDIVKTEVDSNGASVSVHVDEEDQDRDAKEVTAEALADSVSALVESQADMDESAAKLDIMNAWAEGAVVDVVPEEDETKRKLKRKNSNSAHGQSAKQLRSS